MKKDNRNSVPRTEETIDTGNSLSARQKVILDTLLREYEAALMLDLVNDSYEIIKLGGRFSRTLSGLFRDKFSVTMLEVADRIIIVSAGRTKEMMENENLSAEQVLKYCDADH